MTLCEKFTPGIDASICECKFHWNDHTLGARTALFGTKDGTLISSVLNAVRRDNHYPCKQYMPKHDWVSGTPAPDCVCDRPRSSHQSSDVIVGIKAWRAKYGMTMPKACEHFKRSSSAPGKCSICKQKWIIHASPRPLVVETFIELHKTWCKCIIMNGDIQCSCMSDEMIQNALDNAEVDVVSCKLFKPKSTGNTICGCGEQFYAHSTTACNGHKQFLDWRAAHMNNKELLEWFCALPGANRTERINYLKLFVTNPNFKHTPPQGKLNPNLITIQGLLDALDNSHLIQSPNDIEKAARREVVDALVIHAEDLPLNRTEGKFHCYSCCLTKALNSGAMCPDCTDTLANSHMIGPALRAKEIEHG